MTAHSECYFGVYLWESAEQRKILFSVKCWEVQRFLFWLRKGILLLEELFLSIAKSQSLRSPWLILQKLSHAPGLSFFPLQGSWLEELYITLFKTLFFTLFRINLREFRFAQTMIFAVEEINNSSTLLPNISVGYKIFDSCGSTLPSTRAVMGLLNGQERTAEKTCSSHSSVHVIIGASESSSTIVMLQICGTFQIPVVSIYNICVNFL